MQYTHQTSSLLIGLPKGFGFRGFFASKIERLLSALQADEITVMQDAKSIASSYFSELGMSVQQIDAIPRLSLKRKLAQFTHVIIFWDGEDLSDVIFTAKLLKKQLRIVPIEITKVRNKDKDEPYDVYIGRGTPWGNPFPIGKGGVGDTREDVIRKYKEYFEKELLTDPERKKALLSLKGYRLACHCKPLACHGDVIASYLNSLDDLDDASESDLT
ncbi:DUF4326 domain-containing protein [Oxalobacteraceae bacterium OTU3CINTB1]|nr:DUF4326 domain-containing protein [Oxalobacteraceae bacterium OTU3CINTB1]